METIIKRLIYLFVAMAVCSCAAKTIPELKGKETVKLDSVYHKVETKPEYPGGIPALKKFITDNTIYPSSDADYKGMVVVKFVIKTDGTVSDAEIVRSVLPMLDKEAIRVVLLTKGWKPGTIDGKPVNCYFLLPVKFDTVSGSK